MKKRITLFVTGALLLLICMPQMVHSIELSGGLPVLGPLPSLKLYINESSANAFDLRRYLTSGHADSYAIETNFLGLSSLVGSVVSQNAYSSSTIGRNSFQATNSNGSTFSFNDVKYTTYKMHRLPQLVLRPGKTRLFKASAYVRNASGPSIPESFGNNESLIVSDTTQISATWSDSCTILLTAFAGFNTPQSVEIIAAPVATDYAVDIDKEKMDIFPSISTVAFEFNDAADTSVFSYQLPGGVTSLPSISVVTGVADGTNVSSYGGALQIGFGNISSGVKLTPVMSAWLPNSPNVYYTLRVRLFGTSTGNTVLQTLFNGVPGKCPTDIQGYFKFSMPTAWTEFDIPVSSYSPVSSAPVMYPQLVLKANGVLGNVYIDDLEIFQTAPELIGSPRGNTEDANHGGGSWDDSNSTTNWAIQSISGSALSKVSSGFLIVNTSGPGNSQQALKFTATTTGSVYTVPVSSGHQAGMHLKTRLASGSTNLTLTQVQINLLGTNTPGGVSQSGDIGAAAEIGRISDRYLRLAFDAAAPNYQVQFVVKNSGNSSIELDDSQADTENEDELGDSNLFPDH